MTTDTRHGRLFGWSVRCVSVALALAFCASAFADPGKNVVVSEKQRPIKKAKTVKKVCYTLISDSAIPQPCDRIRGAIPTTATDMIIYRNGPAPKD
jgi:hypothetical protein